MVVANRTARAVEVSAGVFPARMRKDKIRAHCPRCRHQQLFVQAETHHVFHFLLTLCTAGLWVISWLAVCVGKYVRPYRCEHCGWHKPDLTGDFVPVVRTYRAPRRICLPASALGVHTPHLQP